MQIEYRVEIKVAPDRWLTLASFHKTKIFSGFNEADSFFKDMRDDLPKRIVTLEDGHISGIPRDNSGIIPSRFHAPLRMGLLEAIQHCNEIADSISGPVAEQNRQLADWLTDYHSLCHFRELINQAVNAGNKYKK